MRGAIALNRPIVLIQTVNTFLKEIKIIIICGSFRFDKICILNVAKSTFTVESAILLRYGS